MKFKLITNNFWAGVIPGLLIPVGFMYLFILAVYKGDSSTVDVVKELYKVGTLPAFLGVSVVPNLILFFQYMRKEYWIGGRGILFATLLYGMAVIYIKFML